ncbi:MAG: RagB/SusD family nutrient uptake outer membrane protein [Bacteroidales bacterium]|nr:RagB/SusD family nutrient uptake outer membrane protein [Bacteroidales bacterium]
MIKRTILIICTVVPLLSSCLKEDMRSAATSETYYRSAAQIRSGITGCYTPMRSIMSARGFWLMTEADTDLMYLASSTAYDANCDVSPARPSFAATLWRSGYQGLMYTNSIIADMHAAMDKGYVTETDTAPLEAEAQVLRAMYLYLLTSSFGDVPFYTEKVTEENRSRIATLPRMSASATRDSCILWMRKWILEKKALPMQRTYTGENYRAGAAVGLMLGAKCAIWNQEWDTVLEFTSALEDIYGKYVNSPESFGQDYPLADIPFTNKYIAESIWEIGNQVDSYGLQINGAIAPVTMPTRRSFSLVPEDYDPEDDSEAREDAGAQSGSDYYDGIVIPELGGYARTSAAVRPTGYYYQQLLPYASEDLRSGEYSNASDSPRGGSGNLAWRWSGYKAEDSARAYRQVMFFFFGSSSSGGTSSRPWLGNKFWCPGMYNNKDNNNYRFFRFADVLLMKAEALLHLGDGTLACQYLNITRTRAGLSPLTYAGMMGSNDALMEEIRRERAKELFGEFTRKYDLVRWGIWYDRTKAYNDSKYLQNNIRPCHRYWPIPADQVSYSGGALDNSEYAR